MNSENLLQYAALPIIPYPQITVYIESDTNHNKVAGQPKACSACYTRKQNPLLALLTNFAEVCVA